MCQCEGRILQPITYDEQVFEHEFAPTTDALSSGDVLLSLVQIPCFFRSKGAKTELLQIEFTERIASGGTLVKGGLKLILLGYGGYAEDVGSPFAITSIQEVGSPLLASEKIAATVDYDDLSSLVSHAVKVAKQNTVIQNPKVFDNTEKLIETSAWFYLVVTGSATYNGYDCRLRVKYRRY